MLLLALACGAAWLPCSVCGTAHAAEVRNYVWNGSFERWVEDKPDGWRVGPVWSDFHKENWGIEFACDAAERVLGAGSLRITNTRATNKAALDCPYFWLPGATQFALSFWLRSDRQRQVTVVFYGRFAGASDKVERQLAAGPVWSRHVMVTPHTAPGSFDRFHVAFLFDGKGSLWVDAVQVEAGAEAHNYQPHWAETPRPPIPCPVTSEAPRIDGALTEAAWRGAHRVPLLPQEGVPGPSATLYLAQTKEALLIAAECPQAPTEIRAPQRAAEGELFADDRVELFLSRMPGGRPYYHFVVTAAGSRYDAEGFDGTWGAEWECAAKVGDGGWTMEAAIPFGALGDAGSSFSLGAFRVFGGGGRFESLSPNGGMFHVPEAFSPLNGLASTPGLQRPRVAEARMWRMPDGCRLVRMKVVPGSAERETWEWAIREEEEDCWRRGTVRLHPGRVGEIQAVLPARATGFAHIGWRLTAGQEKAEGRRRWVAVESFLQASLDRSFYTVEQEAIVLAQVAPWERPLTLRARLGGVVREAPVVNGRAEARLEIGSLGEGEQSVEVQVLDEDGVLAAAGLPLIKRAAKGGQVKCDYLRRCLAAPEPVVLVMPGWGPADMLADIRGGAFNTAMQWTYDRAVASVYQEGPLTAQVLQGYGDFLDEARKAGVRVLFHLPLPSAIGAAGPVAAALVDRFKEHPALLGWLLADEPEGRVPVERLQALGALVRRLDPDHPVWINCAVWRQDAPAQHRAHAAVSDLFSIDVYPIPQEGAWAVPEWLETARAASGAFKPIAVWVQAFGGVEWWRWEPTAPQERAMVYAALARGACGVFFFTYRPRGEALWREVRRLADEMRALTPVLTTPGGAISVPTSCRFVTAGAFRGEQSSWLVLANTAPTAIEADLYLGEALGGVRLLRARSGNREIQATGGVARVRLAPHETGVYLALPGQDR